MLECPKCGADRSGAADGEPCPKCGEVAGSGAEAASPAQAVEPAAAPPDAGGEGRAAVGAGGSDWTDDTSPDSEERIKPADLEAWRKSTGAAREVPVRQPPPGLRPSRRSSTGGGNRASPITVPPPPPMEFTPVPDMVSDATPAPGPA